MDIKVNEKQNQNGEKTLLFVKEVAKYFMDFLETDFHKRKTPRRGIKYKTDSNLLVGLNLDKYQKFNDVVVGKFAEAFKDKEIKIKKGIYKAKIPKNLLDLIKIKIEDISEKEIEESVKKIGAKIKKFAEVYSDEYDKSLVSSMDSVTEIVKEKLVLPFIQKIEKSLDNLSLGDENVRYLMEEELTEVIVGNLENKISEILKLLVSEKDVEVENEIEEVFDYESVKALIVDFFEDFKIADLFSEILEINRNKNILDKQDFYFYFFDITYNRAKYPIFYIPFEVENGRDTITINIDSQLYINKKALEYIVQEYNKEKEKSGGLKNDTERIIYLAQGKEEVEEIINGLLSELVNYFELNCDLSLGTAVKQRAKSSLVNISNSCYVSLFDKSDEALVNDYEDILQLLSSGEGALSELFIRLVDDFINKEPVSFNLDIDDEWEETETSDKLIVETPIPLNSEQRKIVSALKKNDCKYITVQGPPGTGKSHTITAIVFNAILDNKSVLVLSDKKEALDVVEDKIKDTMNKVRNDNKFQNPILRLGKTGNTYSQILSTNAIENIRTHYQAVRRNLDGLENNLEKIKNSLKDDIEAESLAYNDLNKNEIKELLESEELIKDKELIFEEGEMINNHNSINDIEEVKKIFSHFQKIFGPDKNDYIDFLIFHGIPQVCFSNFDNFKKFLEYILKLQKGFKELQSQIKDYSDFKLFNDFKTANISRLEKYIEQYEAMKSPLIGYLFKKKRVEKLDRSFTKDFDVTNFDTPHKDLGRLQNALNIFRHIQKNEIQNGFNFDYLRLIHHLFINPKHQKVIDEYVSLVNDVNYLLGIYNTYQKTFALIGFNFNNIDSFYYNALVKIDENEYNKIIRYFFLKQKIVNAFKNIPRYSYLNQQGRIQDLTTTQMTYMMDERLIKFYETSRSTARTLRDIIKKKQRFPREEFTKLKEAFPCILAGIRDYAEYIPLETEVFDLVIIDEASQVSVSQAFPAIIRAKQILILGDKRQFSNIKAAQAKTETNLQYLNDLESSFKDNVSSDIAKLERIKKFNIKTSILEFFEHVSNFNIQLRKHFRGYKEIISYSNRYFYEDSLQVMKIRGKQIDDVLKITTIEHDGKLEPIAKTNKLEADFIIAELKKLKEIGCKSTIGIITPHTNQQKLLIDLISQMPEKDYLFDELNLKIMTFDTCQGEERDIIYYSMVATKENDRLWGIFIKSLQDYDLEEEGKIRAQRLNVGFSRAKECMHFVLSMAPEDYKNSIGEAIRHYKFILDEAKREPLPDEVDKNSPMEKEVLNWLTQTKFWKENVDKISLMPQFEIGKYLKQLDSNYNHPNYVVDFLLIYNESGTKKHHIIIEYDGFREHFVNREAVGEFNHENYYSDDDIYRQKVLEGYGYKFIRLNKFNIGKNQIDTLNERVLEMVNDIYQEDSLITDIHETVEGLVNGDYKECPKCKDVKSKEEFKDITLVTGYGRFCRDCKNLSYKKSFSSVKTSKEPPVLTSVLCPRCNFKMVLRRGRYGKFYGCSRFPYCKGTRKA